MEDPVIYQLALTRITGIGPVYTKLLIDRFGDARAVFHADKSSLTRAGINDNLIAAILQFSAYAQLEKELQIQRRKGIRMLFFTDADYPQRLLALPESTPLLFYQGVADLNAEKIIAVVGTRRPTDYGKQITKRLIRELAQPNLLLLSGLAFGIDSTAHAAALEYDLPTIGVLAHGFEYLYPREHAGLATAMRRHGGLLTSFPYHTSIANYRFPVRNSLVAGLCDALVVIETGDKGGSLITADDAIAFSKKIFAVPGRITDEKSRGCLRLVSGGKAELLVSGEQVQASMGWKWPAGRKGRQAALPFPADDSHHPVIEPHLSTAEQQVITLLQEKETLSIDELAAFSQLNRTSLSVSLLNLEMRGSIHALPGKRYRLTC